MSASGKFFVQKGCSGCHTIRSLGVQGRPGVAPDLSNAAEDVPARFGISLEKFLERPPSGTMALVLSQQILLTPEERATAARNLREALEEHRRRAGALRP
jgi:hypothetical protein